MANGTIIIMDENDKNAIENQISNHTSNAANPHGVTAQQIGAAILPTIATVTLSSSSWNANTLTQKISVTGVLEDASKQIINVSPVGSSMITAANSVIYCSGQETDALIFTCLEIPTADIVYNISIQDIMYTGGNV